MYYQRRKCSQNVYFLELSRERSSEPVLKQLPSSADNIQVWNTSIDKIPEQKINSSSIATLRITGTTGYDWRRDRNETSVDNLPSSRGLQLILRNNLKQHEKQENNENLLPVEGKLSLEEQNKRLKDMLTQYSEENRTLKDDLAKVTQREKEFQEQIRLKNRRIDELERDKWMHNYKIAQLEKKGQVMEETYKSRVDPNELSIMMKKIEVLETLQRQMEREIEEDHKQWQQEKSQFQQNTHKLFR